MIILPITPDINLSDNPWGSCLQLPRIENNISVYSGWGPDQERNLGDELCHTALAKLINIQDESFRVTDIRPSCSHTDPVLSNDLIIGGGTVLPFALDKIYLNCARRIFVFGSGCLNLKEISHIRGDCSLPYSMDILLRPNVKFIGVRGPNTAKFCQRYFSVDDVRVVGDLAFAHASDLSLKPSIESRKVSFFFIENPNPKARIYSSLSEIQNIYLKFAEFPLLNNFQPILCSTYGYDDINRPFQESDKYEFTRVDSVQGLLEKVRDSNIVITERLHPAIIACMLGKPFIYLQTTSKSFDFQEMMIHFSEKNNIELDVSKFFVPCDTYEPRELLIKILDSMSYLLDKYQHVSMNLMGMSNQIENELMSATVELIKRLKSPNHFI
jgi:hypothetical protein